MNVSVGGRWEGFIDSLLKDGRYGSASEVVREGLRLVEEREARLAALRDHIDSAVQNGGDNSFDDARVAIEARRTQRIKAAS